MLKEFCEYLTEKGCSMRTIETYNQAVDGYMEWYQATFGEPLRRLYRANVLDYISYLRTVRKLVNRSVNTKLAALQNLNDYLIGAGVQTETVLSKQDYLKVQTSYANPSTINREQVEAFRQRVLEGSGKQNYAIVTIDEAAVSGAVSEPHNGPNTPIHQVIRLNGRGCFQLTSHMIRFVAVVIDRFFLAGLVNADAQLVSRFLFWIVFHETNLLQLALGVHSADYNGRIL